MTTWTCIACKATIRNVSSDSDPADRVFCAWCEPDTCYWCPASAVQYDTEHVRCSHGCEHTIHEYTHYHCATVLMNGSPAEKLAYGGPHIEVIIPNGTPTTVYESVPDPGEVPDSHLLTTHYTVRKDRVLETGVVYPPHEHSTERADWATGTVREHALYAWPFTPAYTDRELDWGELPENDPVVVSVPENAVYVSSYNFLEWLGDPNEPYRTHLTIPHDKYETEFLFDPVALHAAATTFNRPCRPDDLLLYTHRDEPSIEPYTNTAIMSEIP